jgi:dTMP kinase
MFVVFEGIDGSGKTTVSNQVAERLKAGGLAIKHLRAEGKFVSAVSEAIRDLGRDARNIELTPQAEFLLYVARDVQLIEEALRPALKQTDVVLADRFLFTAEILGRQGRHLPAEFTNPILKAAAGGLVPDLVILVDVDPVLARARRKAYKLQVADRRPPSRKGLSGVGLQHRLRRGYQELAAESPERWVVVKNEDSLEETVARVTELIQTAHAEGAPRAIERFHKAVAAATPSRSEGAVNSTEEALAAFLGWIDRRMEREPRVAAYLLGGLFGSGIDERRRALVERVPEAVLAALSGRIDAVSWQLRNELAPRYAGAVLRTISGMPNTEIKARDLRVGLESQQPAEVAMTLSTLDDELSWQLRERLFERYPDLVMGSVTGLDSKAAWEIRERWLEGREQRIPGEYDVARVVAKSVSGVPGERAAGLREQARKAAPVAALASIGLLDDAESWRRRQEYLRLAPKVVMGTIRRSADARAWEMRRAVVADCKEAVDSIQDIDSQEAWELRWSQANVWPSTVAKSLGPLSDGPRGQELLLKLLAAHPTNVSLLKHASAVALGVHKIHLFED